MNDRYRGYIRRDSFGRFYVDTCESDAAHLTAPAIPGQERRGCRRYLDDLFEDLEGKVGFLSVDFFFESEKWA